MDGGGEETKAGPKTDKPYQVTRQLPGVLLIGADIRASHQSRSAAKWSFLVLTTHTPPYLMMTSLVTIPLPYTLARATNYRNNNIINIINSTSNVGMIHNLETRRRPTNGNHRRRKINLVPGFTTQPPSLPSMTQVWLLSCLQVCSRACSLPCSSILALWLSLLLS